jgi:hypothetical protein
MAPHAARAAEKQGLAHFPGVGIGERQHQPSIRNKPFELFPFALRLGTANLLFSIVLDADTFHLAFTGAGFTGINDRLATGFVQGELVAWHLTFLPASASAPPISIAGLCASLRRPHHRELSVNLADSVSGG